MMWVCGYAGGWVVWTYGYIGSVGVMGCVVCGWWLVMCVVWVHWCVYVWLYVLCGFMDGVGVRVSCLCGYMGVWVMWVGVFCELWLVCRWYGCCLGVWAYVCIDDARLWDMWVYGFC